MKKQLLVGMTLCLSLLTAPLASMASLGRGESAPYKAQAQAQRVSKATKSVKTSKAPRQARSSNVNKGGEMPKSASCGKRSNTSLFAQTAYVAPVDKTVKNGVSQKAVN